MITYENALSSRDALEEFRQCEKLIPSSNSTVLRDVLEAKIRCAIRLGRGQIDGDMSKVDDEHAASLISHRNRLSPTQCFPLSFSCER